MKRKRDLCLSSIFVFTWEGIKIGTDRFYATRMLSPIKKRKVLQKNKPLRKQRGLFLKLTQMAYCNNLETICGVWFA